MNILEIIAKIIQIVAPSFKVSLIDKLQFSDKLMLSDNLHININIDLKDIPKSKTVIMPRTQYTDNEIKNESMIIESIIEESQSLITYEKTAVSTGLHIMLNNPLFWNDFNGFKWKQICILPYVTEKKLNICTLESISRRHFELYLCDNGDIQTTIWSGTKPEIVKFDNNDSTTHSAGGSFWFFEKKTPDKILYFPKLPEIIISFDEKIVKDYLIVTRKPHIEDREEYYILVNKNE